MFGYSYINREQENDFNLKWYIKWNWWAFLMYHRKDYHSLEWPGYTFNILRYNERESISSNINKGEI